MDNTMNEIKETYKFLYKDVDFELIKKQDSTILVGFDNQKKQIYN